MQVVVLPRAPLGSRVWTSRLVEKASLQSEVNRAYATS